MDLEFKVVLVLVVQDSELEVEQVRLVPVLVPQDKPLKHHASVAQEQD